MSDLKDGYTLAQIKLFARAAQSNRRLEVMQQAIGVSLGIHDGLSKDSRLLKTWFAQDEGQPQPDTTINAGALAWFQARPVKGN